MRREEEEGLGCGTLPGTDESAEVVGVGGVVVGGDGEQVVPEDHDERTQISGQLLNSCAS